MLHFSVELTNFHLLVDLFSSTMEVKFLQMSVNRILCTEESLLITLNKILTGRECISLPVFLLIKSSPSSGDVDNLDNAYIVLVDGDLVSNAWYGDFDNSFG